MYIGIIARKCEDCVTTESSILKYTTFLFFVKKKIAASLRRNLSILLLPEGHAVRTLVHGGVCLMGADQDPLQRAEVGLTAVMGALGNSTLDALIGMTVHRIYLLF